MHVNPYQSPALAADAAANKPLTILMIVLWLLLAIPLGAAVSVLVTVISLMLTLEVSSGIKELVCIALGFATGLTVMAASWTAGLTWLRDLLTPDH